MRKKARYFTAVTLLTLCSVVAPAQKATRRVDALAYMWKDPGDIASRDLLHGSGGTKHVPSGPFTFVKEDLDGSNPKFVVRDGDGGKWKVKLGEEVQPETAAARLVWAVGYFTDDDYYLPEIKVNGLPSHLHRGQNQVRPGGVIRNVRLKREQKSQEKQAAWKWGGNAFTGTRELNGLRVMMALINNWDLKDENNGAYEVRPKDADPQRVFYVKDLGATFGTTGRSITRADGKGNLKAYVDSKFITKVEDGFVNFGTPSRAAAVHIFEVPAYVNRLKLSGIGDHIPIEDCRWIGGMLAKLSPEQIRDAFRAAGYDEPEVEGFAKVVEDRIAQLNGL